MSALSGRAALVTGATGFIGGRLVEKLVLESGARVRALVRDFSHASRLARFPVEMVPGGLRDDAALDRAVSGSDVVFHCAHDFRDPEANLSGIRRLAEACLRHRVSRLVYTSSISVYEPLPDGDLDESTPAEPSGWAYKDSKIAAERLLLSFHREKGLPVAIILPTIVYGPFGGAWTVRPVKDLRQSRVVLPQDRPGRCNAVYVDDCVDALILAATQPAAIGQRLLVSGPDAVTWHEFFEAYERMVGTGSLTYMPADEIRRLSGQSSRLASAVALTQDPRRILRWPVAERAYRFYRRHVKGNLRARLRKAVPKPLLLPDEQKLALYGASPVVRFDRARQLLGYDPRFPFDAGMRLTAQFVKWAAL